VLFRTVHGALINPKIFIGAGTGIDFQPNQNAGIRAYSLTFPFFAEFREYVLEGNFNIFSHNAWVAQSLLILIEISS
jgi:hypothetical protein